MIVCRTVPLRIGYRHHPVRHFHHVGHFVRHYVRHHITRRTIYYVVCHVVLGTFAAIPALMTPTAPISSPPAIVGYTSGGDYGGFSGNGFGFGGNEFYIPSTNLVTMTSTDYSQVFYSGTPEAPSTPGTPNTPNVPEPSSIVSLLSALGIMALFIWRKIK